MKIRPLEIAWTHRDGLDYKPSWKREQLFINPEHAQIWERTKHLPGWQDPADSHKLYEMAYYCGQIILEIGVFGGRSAAVELRGALAGQTDEPPQYYGLDIDPGFLGRSLASVKELGVDQHCLFYHGNLQQFLRDLPVVPTMVFVDGDHQYAGVIADLRTLQGFLAPWTPVLCHDYHAIEGVRRAVDEVLQTPHFRLMGLFAGCALLQSTDACPGKPRGLEEENFQRARLALLQRYETALSLPAEAGHQTPVSDLLEPLRIEVADRSRGASGRAEWPYSAPLGRPMPATLPDGRPWPRISIVTPSFNQGQYIEQTILSVANQNYPNVEHIVMDGGSTDDTVAVLEKYSSRLAFWASEKDRGQSNAINKGFAKATGEIVTWLNSDDLLAPGALAAIALAFETSGADLVAGICQLHRDGEIYDQHLTCCPDGPLPLAELLDLDNYWLAGQFFYQPEVFFKRALLLKVGGQVNEEMFWGMDYDLWVRFAQAGARLKVIGRPVAQFRVHEEQKTQDEGGFKVELRALVKKLRPALQMPEAPAPITDRKRQLRIVFLNDSGFRYGAGIGHHRLARAARLAGHEVIPIAIGNDNLTDSQKALPFAAQIVPRLQALAPDVVVVGNVHGAGLDPACLKELADALPTVFVLHDGWLLSGRCAYRGGCTKHLTGCEETCPTPNEYPRLDPALIAPAWRKKMELIQTAPKLVLAANSRWNEQQVEAVATALQAPAHSPARRPMTLRLGVPLDVFRPRDPAFCREMLHLPADKFILLFSCSNLADKRKGVDHLIQAIRKLNLPDLLPVCIGYNDGSTPLDLPNLVSVGYINDPHHQALLYSAADLFVAPSLEEAFGQVFIEAAACGTPSVAYPVGGVPEALSDGVVGRLAAEVHPDALAKAIEELYWNPQLRTDLGWWGRCHVQNEFSLESCSRSLFFAFREAVRLAGVDLTPKLQFQVQPEPLPAVSVLLESLGYISSSTLPPVPQSASGVSGVGGVYQLTGPPLERAMLEYYQWRLAHFRRRPTPWWLKPKAWLARINRNALRKAVLRNSKDKNAGDGVGQA